MSYLLLFLDGIITFVSPCMLPMLPLYISYFAGGDNSRKRAVKNALGFIIGFSVVFIILGAFAGTIGGVLIKYRRVLDIIMGLIVITLGLNYVGILQIGILNRSKGFQMKSSGKKEMSFLSSVLFGIVFSVGWTPCVSTFLGTALMLAASSNSTIKGVMLLLSYCLGLGIPFLLSAVMISQLKAAFGFIKRHYKIVNMISGILLILMGIFMITGYFGRLLSAISIS